ncbi:FecR family protein [Sphingomonas faeni]|uniref:FecR family protein n=1 Tax=Sphingomonas faeni TaxID=185950 RepID=UPI0027811F8D|nr:FecR domain-containing protein [Sphingomonas faeni]MDQ0839218.1 transmembrane sensor [Sphingomonas faeni]
MAISDGSTPDDQAAAWLARLRNKSVRTSELDDFARWRRDPLNAAAYRQASMDDDRRLSEDPEASISSRSAGTPGLKWGRMGSATFAFLGVLAMILIASGLDRVSPPPTVSVYRTDVGERSTVTLDDGSHLELDADSEASARFDGTRRRLVLLRGGAFFAVRHDAARPFVVEVGDGLTVTAIGTRFDVRLVDRKARVTLVEGSVEVRRSGALLLTMKPGEAVVVGGTGAALPLRRPPEEVLGWRNGHVSFHDTPLEQAVAEMNRYTRRPFSVGPDTDARTHVSGEFSTDDPEGFANAMEALLGEGAIRRASR